MDASVDRRYCRAQIAQACEGSRDAEQAEGDNTYDPETGTFVCDACYLRAMPFSPSGRALAEELEEAIEAARRAAKAMTRIEGEK